MVLANIVDMYYIW